MISYIFGILMFLFYPFVEMEEENQELKKEYMKKVEQERILIRQYELFILHEQLKKESIKVENEVYYIEERIEE